jgi:hypothetical protein
MSLLRAAQPGSTRSIDTYVKTDVSFKQRRTEAEDSHVRREAYSLSSTVPMVEVRRACSRKQILFRRSDALSHIQFSGKESYSRSKRSRWLPLNNPPSAFVTVGSQGGNSSGRRITVVQQKGLNKWIDIAVEHAIGVADFDIGTVIFD